MERFIQRKRDLVLLDLLEDFVFVLACDSNASIGLKQHDQVRREWKEVGRSAAKVPLMEVLASGALPVVVVDNLCVEPEPAGKGILEGIRFEVENLGLDPDLVIIGSTEKNMSTTQTGLGVTVLGIAHRNGLQIGTSRPGAAVVCVGLPKNAPDLPYFEGEPGIMNPLLVKQLRQLEYVQEIVPVGSHGVLYEMEVLAVEANCRLSVVESTVDLKHSAGASTCVLATLSERLVPTLIASFPMTVSIVGLLQVKS